MRAAVLITRLYPPAVRERWGAEISHEVSESGIRSWPDALGGAARLWLHPGDWPETLAGQTCRVLAVALFAVTAVTALLLRATEPSAALTADVGHPATSLWLAPIVVGIALAAPRPPLRWDALRHLTTVAFRTLTAPAVAVVAMFVTGRSGLIEHPTGLAHAALIVYYWATLGLTAICLCTLIARVARTVTTPSTRRLCAALLLLGTGLALAATQSLLAIVWTPAGTGSLTVTLALGLLAAATISAGQDLRRASA
ncbi:MAG: hypothetical protein JWP48_1213 [Actinoallomurus sp.]|jgi:hypothetical protein|nr:hypothetical protein [Actinoallomurus sp.]